MEAANDSALFELWQQSQAPTIFVSSVALIKLSLEAVPTQSRALNTHVLRYYGLILTVGQDVPNINK